MPIIGENECGKTTILRAIFAFDFNNDKALENGSHIKDIFNRYDPADLEPAEISAVIELTGENDKQYFVEIIKKSQSSITEETYDTYIKSQPDEINIIRRLNGSTVIV